jgi:hypothetical protein
MTAADVGAIIGGLLIFGAPFILIQLFRGAMAVFEYFTETRPYRKSPEYAAEVAAREEKARRRAVEAHRDANTAEHDLWDQHFETLGGMWFCPECGHPYRRHRVECDRAAWGQRMLRKARH